MNYKEQVETYIKKEVTEEKYRERLGNYSTLENYWNIGRLIFEAQGGEARAKYGNSLIKEWSRTLRKHMARAMMLPIYADLDNFI